MSRHPLTPPDAAAAALRAARLGVLVLGIPVLGIGGLSSCTKADPPPPPRQPTGINVLLISLDSTRQDLLSAYGREPAHAPGLPTSPAIDRLAEEGVLFEDAYATTSWTLPSHASILTGLPELVHGVELDPHRLGEGTATAAEILNEAGYRTAGFFSGPYLDPRYGFGRGFERYEACYGTTLASAAERTAAAAARVEELHAAGAAGEAELGRVLAELEEARRVIETSSHRDVSSEAVTAAAIEELEAISGDRRPFFLFVHYFDPHYDYTPPAPNDKRFDPGYEGSIDGEDFYESPEISIPDSSEPGKRVRVVSERDLEHVLALYEGELAWTDENVGRLLRRLDALDFEETTLVILTADHGDEFFEHGGIGHRRTLHEEVVRVPLIARLPGSFPPGPRSSTARPAGTRVAGPVSTLSILPTILEVAGVDPPYALPFPSLLAVQEGAPGGRPGLVGRFVGRTPFAVTLPGDELPAAGHLYTVIETYHEGSIKLTRKKRWMVAPEGISAELHSAIQLENAMRYGGEELTWIDLARSPAERDADRSRDFSDGAAGAALERFRSLYADLLAERRLAGWLEPGTSEVEMLRGLGYADAGEPAGHEHDALILPLPGEEVLR